MNRDSKVLYDKTVSDELDESDELDDSYLADAFNMEFKHDAIRTAIDMGLSRKQIAQISAKYESKESSSKKDRKKGKKKSSLENGPIIWGVGQACRAVFDGDNLEYEAVIQKIKGNKAIVVFQGYGNKQMAFVDSLKPSLGKEAIAEQISKTLDVSESTEEKLSEGFYCRVLNPNKGCNEEAVIQQVCEEDGTMVVTTIGYGEPLSVPMQNIQPTFGKKERKIQEKKAHRERKAKVATHPKTNGQTEQKVKPETGKNVRFFASATNIPPPPLPYPPPSSETIMRPENSTEALACMMSSMYLSGYYAGFYTCLQNQPPK